MRCHGSHIDSITMRMRWGNFGIGISPKDQTIIQLGCDHFQLSWNLKTLGFCGVGFGSCIAYKVLKTTRAISVGVNAPIPTMEVLYNDKWYKVPTGLWLN